MVKKSGFRPFAMAGLLWLAAATLLRAQPVHPILTITGSGSGASNILTGWTESQYTNDFIPHSPPRNDAQGFAPAVVSGDTGWSWSASAPNSLTSTPSGIVFPNTNAAYPVQTQAVTVFLTTATNNLTRTVNATYYRPAGNPAGLSMVFNVIDYNKLNQLRGDLDTLAPAYLNSGSSPATRNDAYARRIALALVDWARWHPAYYLTDINSPGLENVTTNYVMAVTTGSFGLQRASDHNGLAHEWQDDELKAFDAIYNSVVLTNLNAELGCNVRDFITTNLFFDEGDFLVDHVTIQGAIQSNLSGPYAVLPEVARVLARPDYITWMDSYLTATVFQNILRDGCYDEGIGYSIGYLNANQDAATNTQNYFLTWPATNAPWLALSNRSAIYSATFRYGQSQWNSVSLPNGELPSFGDTPFDVYSPVHSNGYSALLPAYGTLALGAGAGSQAVQVNQNFPGNNNHMRSDTTAFVLWAFTNEILGNIRYYNGTPGRQFDEQILAHNAVTINRANESPFPSASVNGNANLTLFEPGNNGFAATEIDGQRDYSDLASRYQRLLLLNSVDLAKPYLVDVLRVTGGTNHDYTLHGAIGFNQTWQCSFPLVTNNNPYPMLEAGETWVEPTSQYQSFPYYGFWRGVCSNQSPGNFQITYRDTNRVSARDLRLWMTDDGTANVYLGMTPNPGRSGSGALASFYNYWRPSAIIRKNTRSGTLSDLFVSVIEPLNAGVTNIVSVTRLPMAGATNESVGLQITFKDGRVDTCLVNLGNPKVAGAAGDPLAVTTADGQYSLTGRLGALVTRTNGDSRVWTMNAASFQSPGRQFATPTNIYWSGLIAGSTRKYDGAGNDAFTTASPLPLTTTLSNKWLSFTCGTLAGTGTAGMSEMFQIGRVVATNGLYSCCFTNDHYLEITNGTLSVEQVAPQRTFTGSNSFEIALSAAAQILSAIPDQNLPLGGSSGALPFNFGNLGTAPGASLAVLATSSNPSLVPANGLVLGGSGTNRTLTVTPAAGANGTAAITVAVTDGLWTNRETFNVSVAPDFGLAATPATAFVSPGNTANFTVTVTVSNTFSGTIDLGVSGLPAGAGAGFSPAAFTNGGISTLTVTAAAGTPPGGYALTLTGTNGGEIVSTSMVLTVLSTLPGSLDWNGGSPVDSDWSDPANWSGVSIATNRLLFFGGTSRLLNTNDTAAGTVCSNLVFNAGAGAFTLTGNPLALAGSLTNDSANPQTLTLGLLFSNSLVCDGAGAPLIIGGGLTNLLGAPGATTLTLADTGTLTNLFNSATSPGGTNVLALNSAAASWTILDNPAATAITVPWVLAVNAGTLNFGNAGSAPALTTTTVNGVPQDNQVGNLASATGTLNFLNGTLTTGARLNTAVAANSTGIINQSGGTLNIGSQFQGANGSGAGEISLVTLAGGTMNVAAGAGPFYVASRGTGTLTLGNSAVLNCSTLDVSRNANGNAIGSVGTVNLNGGTLAASRVGTATANFQTGTANGTAATFNFNGGTLKITSGTAPFFQGSTVPPVIPLTAIVKAGGAIIDSNGNTNTFAEPLLHDTSLGATPDGGLTKNGLGCLFLLSNLTYTGTTTVNAGTLALTNAVNLNSSPQITIAAGATLDVSGRTGGQLTLISGQTLAGSGTVKGTTLLSSNATLAPGNAAGTFAFTGSLTLSNGSSTVMQLSKAPATNELVQVAATLTYGGTLTLTNVSSTALAAGDAFKLFSAATYTGHFAGVTPALPGLNLAWNTNSLAAGTLSIVASPTPPPVFTSLALSGTDFVCLGSNGVPNWPYQVLATTNLTAPVSSWTVIATNQFDSAGIFTFTNPVSPATPRQFWLIQLKP